MSFTYNVCNGINVYPIQISMEYVVGSNVTTNWNEGSVFKQNTVATYRVTLDRQTPQDISVSFHYTAHIYQVGKETQGYYSTIYDFFIVPAYSVGHYDVHFETNLFTSYPFGDQFVLQRYDQTMVGQGVQPNCAPPPIECHLGIPTITHVPPTVRGGNDASITCTASGATGTTLTWKLNGVTYAGTSTTNHTFTGLTAGNYHVYITQGGCSYQSNEIAVQDGEFRTGDFNVNEPSVITAVENPIVLTLGSAINSLNPQYSKSQIVVDGEISDVIIDFTLTFPQQYNATFESRGYPDQPTYFLESVLRDEYGVAQGRNSNVEITTSIAECLQNDSVINKYYFISNSGNTITLVAKEYGAYYDLTSTNVQIYGTGITLTKLVNGQAYYDGQYVGNYSLYTEIFVNTDLQFGAVPDLSTYRRVAEIELPFDVSNQHLFDLSPILKTFVSSDKVSFTFTGFTSLPKMDTTYYCIFGEKYPLIPNTNTKKKRYKGITDVKYTINSALDFESINDMSAFLGTRSGSTNTYTGVTFLNTAPELKYIARGSKEFLYFILKANYPNALSLRGDIYYYNGTSDTNVKFFDISTLNGNTNFGGCTMLACGYDELKLYNYESSGNTKIRRIDFAVWQTTPSNVSYKLTTTRSYLLEIDEQPSRFNVAFLNKLGTYETFSFVGEVIEDQEINRQSVQIPIEINNNGSVNKGFEYNSVYDTQYTKLWTVNSGTVNEDTYYYLMELLQSNKIYNYSNVHENFLTVQSQTSTKSTNTAEYTVQIQFKETIFENNVSN